MANVHEGFIRVDILNPDNFLKIRETLTRIGVPVYGKDDKTLTQVCHILHSKGRFFIVHHKELSALDEFAVATLDQTEVSQKETAALLLEEWGLVTIISGLTVGNKITSSLKVITHKESASWKKACHYKMRTDFARAKTSSTIAPASTSRQSL